MLHVHQCLHDDRDTADDTKRKDEISWIVGLFILLIIKIVASSLLTKLQFTKLLIINL